MTQRHCKVHCLVPVMVLQFPKICKYHPIDWINHHRSINEILINSLHNQQESYPFTQHEETTTYHNLTSCDRLRPYSTVGIYAMWSKSNNNLKTATHLHITEVTKFGELHQSHEKKTHGYDNRYGFAPGYRILMVMFTNLPNFIPTVRMISPQR